MSKPLHIGLVTSGGDCAGLNAIIKAVIYHAKHLHGWKVTGICNGLHGFLSKPAEIIEFSGEELDKSLLREAGTILGSASKGDPFVFPMEDGTEQDRSQEIIHSIKEIGLDALIGIGGDGSLAIMHKLSKMADIPFIAIPKTIDNDISATDQAVGFDTALQITTQALDHLETTAKSHNRIMILEVMGRNAGHIALSTGIAGGADVILIPECSYQIEEILEKLQYNQSHGQTHGLIVVSEGIKTLEGQAITQEESNRLGGAGEYICQKLQEISDLQIRVTNLGHLQRSGTTSPIDRIMGSSFGVKAVDLLQKNKANRLLIWKCGQVEDIDFEQSSIATKFVSKQDPLLEIAQKLGIYIGEPDHSS